MNKPKVTVTFFVAFNKSGKDDSSTISNAVALYFACRSCVSEVLSIRFESAVQAVEAAFGPDTALQLTTSIYGCSVTTLLAKAMCYWDVTATTSCHVNHRLSDLSSEPLESPTRETTGLLPSQSVPRAYLVFQSTRRNQLHQLGQYLLYSSPMASL